LWDQGERRTRTRRIGLHINQLKVGTETGLQLYKWLHVHMWMMTYGARLKTAQSIVKSKEGWAVVEQVYCSP